MMIQKLLLLITIINHVLVMIAEAKYLVHANDSVHLEHCNVENVRNIGEQNPNPEEIIIHDCRVEELPNALFIRFHRLKQLEITESQLHTISDFALNGMRTLQLLNLSRNNLTDVKTWSNEPLISLHLLDLRRNSIVSLDKNAFIHYPNLLKLNLAVNHITHIPDDLFRSLQHLRYLNFAKNLLQTINSYTFKHLHKLLNLELRHNEINLIEGDSFIGTTHMKVLHLQDNILSNFPHELISNMPRLHHLNLSHNRLVEFSHETFSRNEELISLDISYNNMQALQELTFKGLEVLEVLNASHNEIKFIDSTTFNDAGNLQYLDLSNNHLSHLESKIFLKLDRLISLKLGSNSIEHIQYDAFENLKLSYLDLSCNKLSKENFLDWPTTVNVRYLNLTFNDFTQINLSLLENISVDLWGNPFKCEWLVKEVLTSKNVRLGRNYFIDDSNQDISKIEGIECFYKNGSQPHKLLVVVQPKVVNEKDDDINDNDENEFCCNPDSKRKSNFKILPLSEDEEDFGYRSILLWFSLGCTITFIGLRILRCYLEKSENQSENYRKSQAFSTVVDADDDDNVKSSSVVVSIDTIEK